MNAGPQATARWERLQDPLAESLVQVAGLHGIQVDPDALLHGLPLRDGTLDALALPRAAARAGLACRLVSAPLKRLDSRLFPVILLLRDGQACILHRVEEGTAEIGRPALPGATERLPLEELAREYAGRAVYLRPLVRLEAQAGEIHKRPAGHWFWSVLRDYRGLYRDIFLAAVLINLFALAAPLFLRLVYNRVIPNEALATFWVLAGGVAVIFAFELVVRLLRVVFIDRVAALVDSRISAQLMERVLGMRLEARPRAVGAFAANLQSFEFLRNFITSGSLVTLVDLPFALLFLAVVAWISPWLALPVLGGGLLILAVGWLLQGRLRELTETSYRAAAERNAMLVESLQALDRVKALGAEGRVQSDWERLVAFLARLGVRLRYWTAFLSNGALWIQNMSLLALVAVGVHLVVEHRIGVGGLIAAYMLAGRVLAPLSQLAGLMAQYHQAHTALAALEQVMALPREEEEAAAAAHAPRRLRGGLRFEQVGFRYPEVERDVLSGIDFRLRPGERVAVLGRSGSGKSTLARLAAGHYRPVAGRIFLDEVEQGQIPLARLRRQLALVDQEPRLLRGTLQHNLTLGLGETDPERLAEALAITGIDRWVNRHPDGIRQQVGEGGAFLSGGQRQAVALARALLQDPAILVLDEPTGSFDQASEAAFLERFRPWVEGRTLLLVTHRAALLQLVDRILVLDGGRLVADGPREEILAALRSGSLGSGGGGRA